MTKDKDSGVVKVVAPSGVGPECPTSVAGQTETFTATAGVGPRAYRYDPIEAAAVAGLKPCPWCGGEPEVEEYSVGCKNPCCAAQPNVGGGMSQAECIYAWNRRAA